MTDKAQPPAAQPACWVHPAYMRDNALAWECSPFRLSPQQVPLYLQPDPRIAELETQALHDDLSIAILRRRNEKLEGLLARAFKMANDRRNHEHFAALADDIEAALKEG